MDEKSNSNLLFPIILLIILFIITMIIAEDEIEFSSSIDNVFPVTQVEQITLSGDIEVSDNFTFTINGNKIIHTVQPNELTFDLLSNGIVSQINSNIITNTNVSAKKINSKTIKIYSKIPGVPFIITYNTTNHLNGTNDTIFISNRTIRASISGINNQDITKSFLLENRVDTTSSISNRTIIENLGLDNQGLTRILKRSNAASQPGVLASLTLLIDETIDIGTTVTVGSCNMIMSNSNIGQNCSTSYVYIFPTDPRLTAMQMGVIHNIFDDNYGSLDTSSAGPKVTFTASNIVDGVEIYHDLTKVVDFQVKIHSNIFGRNAVPAVAQKDEISFTNIEIGDTFELSNIGTTFSFTATTTNPQDMATGLRNSINSNGARTVNADLFGNNLELTAITPGTSFNVGLNHINVQPIAQVDTFDISGNIEEDDIYQITISGTQVDYTVTKTDTKLEDIIDGIVLTINSDNSVNTSITAIKNNSNSFNLTSDTPGTAFITTSQVINRPERSKVVTLDFINIEIDDVFIISNITTNDIITIADSNITQDLVNKIINQITGDISSTVTAELTTSNNINLTAKTPGITFSVIVSDQNSQLKSQIETITLTGTKEYGDIFNISIDNNNITYFVTGLETNLEQVIDNLIITLNSNLDINSIILAEKNSSTTFNLIGKIQGNSFTSVVNNINYQSGIDNQNISNITLFENVFPVVQSSLILINETKINVGFEYYVGVTINGDFFFKTYTATSTNLQEVVGNLTLLLNNINGINVTFNNNLLIINATTPGVPFVLSHFSAPIINPKVISYGAGTWSLINCEDNLVYHLDSYKCITKHEYSEYEKNKPKQTSNSNEGSISKDDSSLPKDLFDITFEILDKTISSINDLSTKISFENFGSTKTDVTIKIKIYHNTLVYEKSINLTIQTQEILIENFKDLNSSNFPDGSYKIVLTSYYGRGVTNNFEDSFTISKNTEIIDILKLVGIISLVSISIISSIIYLTRFKPNILKKT